MSLPLLIIEFVIALGALLFVHEFGHFITCKLFKIPVEEFGFGLPPRLVRLFKIGETEFTINAIPFGAFVRPKGETDPDIPGGLASANPFKRLTMFLGGPVMNILVGILLFSILFTRIGASDTSVVQVASVVDNTPASQSGLKVGDIILSVNGEKIDSSDKLLSIIKSNLGMEATIMVKRGQQDLTIKAVPRTNPPEGQGPLGIVMGYPTIPVSWFQAVPMAAEAAYNQAYLLITLPAKVIQNQIPAQDARIVGPKGMFDIFQKARTLDEASAASPNTQPPDVNTLGVMAAVSIALGLTNLLPLPALDGGHILFLIPEIFFRRRVPPDKENLVHFIGLAAMIVLMVYITVQDIINPIILP